MVKCCAGLPLAIIVLGGTLSQRNSLFEWQKVSENVKSYLNRNKGNGVQHALALSYDDLPPYLRPCFLYLSHFPEDYEIPVDKLIQLWVAEGIVSEKDEKSGGELMEDVAECYVVELTERCMIQVGKISDATFRILTCRMHDLMRDLCSSKAEEENFLCIIDHPSQFISPIARRIVAHKPTPLLCIKGSHLRSILFMDTPFDEDTILEVILSPNMLKHFEEHEYDEDVLYCILVVFFMCKVQGSWTHLFNKFKLLRVLHFEVGHGFAGMKLPSSIGNLIHLRYLSLGDIEFFWPKIPSSLGNLRCLQTLDLRISGEKFGRCVRSVYVPNVIWKLEQLRHLYLPRGFKQKNKLKLHTLRNLQTLVNFNTQYCFAADLSKLTNLTKLWIRGSFDIEDLDENSPIIKSKRIRYLYFGSGSWIDTRNLTLLLSSCLPIFELRLSAAVTWQLPEYQQFPSSIAYVRLSWCRLAVDPMPILEKFPNLRILEIKRNAFNGNTMVCSAQGFPKLESLCFRRLENLKEWNVEQGAMPTLRHLEIEKCLNLKMFPDGLSCITTLRELKITSMPKELKDKVDKGGEDFFKVQHVPSITFEDCED